MTIPYSTLSERLNARVEWHKAHPWRYRLGRLHYRLRSPVKTYRTWIYWPLRSFWERGRRGWSVRDAWSLDGYISRVLAESLEHLRVNTHGHPCELTAEEWDAILGQMVVGFRRWNDHFDDPNEEDAYKEVQRSLRLMRKWFGHLWD